MDFFNPIHFVDLLSNLKIVFIEKNKKLKTSKFLEFFSLQTVKIWAKTIFLWKIENFADTCTSIFFYKIVFVIKATNFYQKKI